MYYHAQDQQSSWLWHKVPMQKTPQTKMLITSHQVNTYSRDWSSWKANASQQEWLYKTTDVISTEGVDFESLDNFIYFCTPNTDKREFPDFSQTRKKALNVQHCTKHVFTPVRKNGAQKVKYYMTHRKQSLLLNHYKKWSSTLFFQLVQSKST